MQEILTKVWMNLASYNPVYSLSTWIYTIARNHIRDLHRKKKLSSTSLNTVGTTLFIDTKNLSPEDNYFRQRKKRHISRFIDSLDESNREIAYLRFYEHIKIKHIAAIMKMPVGTIKYRISIIKQKLSAYLEDDYGEEGN